MKLVIVILNYRVTALTIDCLRSLAGRIQRIPDAEVAVLENGTNAAAAEELQRAIDENGWGGWAKLTAIETNLGFTGGNNLVIRAALASPNPPEYVLLLNADTVVQDDTLEPLVAFMDSHPRAGIAGSTLLSPDNEVQASPFRFPGILSELIGGVRLGVVSKLLAPYNVVPPMPTEACPVEWVSGACMIIRRELLQQVGLLDEGLYTYFDDIDLCLRAKRAGWETWFVPESHVVHLEGASTNIVPGTVKRRPRYWFQARRRFFLKNYGPLYTAVVDAVSITGFASWRMRRRLQGKPDRDPAKMLLDLVANSVFATGFRVTEVENPALKAEKSSGA